MPDAFDYDLLDPGIRDVVCLLRSWGFETTDSGDGQSKVGTEAEACMLHTPNVAILVRDPRDLLSEADRLVASLRVAGVDLDATRVEDGQELPVVLVEATYSPVSRIGMILVTGLDDAMLPQ